MTKEEGPEKNALDERDVIQESLPKPCYGRWVGVVLAFFFPGMAHWVSGKRKAGVCWYLCGLVLGFSTIFLAGIPGIVFGYAALLLLTAWVIWFIALIRSSWRPIPRFGFPRWILLIAFIVGFNLLLNQSLLGVFRNHCVGAYKTSAMSMAPTLIAPPLTRTYPPHDDFPEEQPTVSVADHFFANQWLYCFRSPKRGELVIFRTDHVLPDITPTIYVKRVVGLPGETVDIQAPYVLINGEKVTDPPIFQVMASRQSGFSGYASLEDLRNYSAKKVELPLTLGPGEYFLLGDNSPRSMDSRFFGPVSQQDIIGRAVRIYYPFSRMGELE